MLPDCISSNKFCTFKHNSVHPLFQDWRLLLERAQTVVSSAVVYIEDYTEHFAAVTTSAMKQFFRNTPADRVTPVTVMDFALKVGTRPGAQSKAIQVLSPLHSDRVW